MRLTPPTPSVTHRRINRSFLFLSRCSPRLLFRNAKISPFRHLEYGLDTTCFEGTRRRRRGPFFVVIREGRRFELAILSRLLARSISRSRHPNQRRVGVDPLSLRGLQKKRREKRGRERKQGFFVSFSPSFFSPSLHAHLVGTRCCFVGFNDRSGREGERNVGPFIRSDSVLTGRDISRRRDFEEGKENGAQDQSTLRLLRSAPGQVGSKIVLEACGPNILLIKI